MIFQAHKGVSTENPENTMPAFIAAACQGYKIIELDVSVTKDGKFVLLHDTTINRTARYKNGDELPHPIKINDITYEEVKEYDFGIWFSKKFKGTPLPLFEDVLKFAKQKNIKLKIDNKYEKFDSEQKKWFFEILKPYEDFACLTCFSIDELKNAYKFFPRMHFHYDGPVTNEILNTLGSTLPKDQLTVWLPLKCSNTSWVKVEFANETLSSFIKQYARLGLWILSDYAQLEEAKKLGADIVETNGQLKPILNKALIADMHTHSENSHDSTCRIEDMCLSQIKNGTNFFAVTDHFDTASFKDYDIFTPIITSCETAYKLNEKYKDEIQVLRGIEISEGFWYPNEYEQSISMTEYDVIIGSVHLVKYKDLTYAYSKIDFSKLNKDTVIEYIDAYFDDVLTMIKTSDFDILAHLTCPLRYIKGKYNIDIDMCRYMDKIEQILNLIIKKGIAMEINTSSYENINSCMPSKDILKKYYDMGGYLLTLGSDAHIAQNASKNFRKALEEIKKIGFNNIFYYTNRKQIQITI